MIGRSVDIINGPRDARLGAVDTFTLRPGMLWLAAMLLAGCAATHDSPIDITEEARQSISVTRIINRIEQEGLDYEVTRSTTAQTMGGGLIPALIDVAVERYSYARSERKARVLEQSLADYGFDHRLNNALTDCLGAIGWLHVSSVRLDKSNDEVDPAAVAQDGEDAVLMIDTHYYLNEDLNKLSFKSSANLYLLAEQAQAGRPEPVFRKRVFFAKSVPASTPEGAIKAWSDSEGKHFIQALDEGIDSLCIKLVGYLGHESDKVGKVTQ